MVIKVDASSLRGTRWYEYGLRFLFGGLITAVAGVIAKKFGPVMGGLFLAFPAIFPSSATLVEKHEKQKKEEKGLPGAKRGREAAALEAVGSALGSVGLFLFALVIWTLLPSRPPWLVLAGATLVWAAASVAAWYTRHKW